MEGTSCLWSGDPTSRLRESSESDSAKLEEDDEDGGDLDDGVVAVDTDEGGVRVDKDGRVDGCGVGSASDGSEDVEIDGRREKDEDNED